MVALKPPPFLRGACGALALAACFLAPCPGRAQAAGAAEEYQVKAAFVYKFAAYVEWPKGALESPETPFTVGVVGSDTLAEELVRVVGERRINGRAVVVRKLGLGEPLTGVRMLFIGQSHAPRDLQLQQWAQKRPLLVVAESEGMLEQGAMINFVVAGQRVRFDIALDAVERSGLRLSSRLLAVARRVTTAGAP